LVIISFGVALGDSWHIETVDTAEDVGYFSSIALDSSDYPHISYCDWFNGDLKYACWAGSTWSIISVDTAGYVGVYTSITLDSSDYPHISYYDNTSEDLKYAYWTGSAWSITSVDTAGDVGLYTSIALDSSDYPHISYYDYTSEDLKYAYWTGSAWSITYVDFGAGYDTSIALDSSDYPHISYRGNNNLKYAYWTGSEWSITSVDTAGYVGESTSIALDSSDYPHISYLDSTNGDLKYAYWTGSTWSITSVDTGGHVGVCTSIALDSSDNPHISYKDYGNGYLKYAYWTGSAWSITTVDTAGYVGEFTSIALDSSDYPNISYGDYTNGDLKYAWYGPDIGINLTAFSALSSDNAIMLNWSVETTDYDQIAGFNLYRREMGGDYGGGGDGVRTDGHPSLREYDVDTWTKVNDHLITGENPYTYTDSGVESGVAYEYRLEAVLESSVETLGTTQATAGLPPASFAILALYPNPASDTLTCLLALPSTGAVELALYDISGRLVVGRRIEVTEPSEMEVLLDVSGLASGVYTLRASQDGMEVSPACGGVAVVVR